MTLSFNVLSKTAGLISLAIVLLVSASGLKAQSTLQDHPTPIIRNELNGTIRARDLGDARLTTYYYWFEGSQGDVFINLTTKNFSGDIDVFTQNGLKTLTKIIVFADFGEVETGRVIYLRKPEKLILRVQGRSPNDESANFRFKFAGSFVAATGSDEDVPEVPRVSSSATGRVQVNSAGTIIPPPPKPVPVETKVDKEAEALRSAQKTESQPTADEKKTTTEAADEKKVSTEIPDETKTEEKKVTGEIPDEKKSDEKLEVVVTDPLPKAETAKPTSTAKRTTPRNRRTRQTTPKKVVTPVDQPSAANVEKKVGELVETPVEAKADPLANVQLVILFKDGRKIERPLTDVFKFSVDGGVLTVIAKDGRTGKYQMVDVAKVTIE